MRHDHVVIVGGGYVGLASAIALAARGLSVTVIERELPGTANSIFTGGGIRQQFATELNIRLSQLSAETWDGFEDLYGIDPLFRRIGYLFVTTTDEEAAVLAGHVRLQNRLGVDSEYLMGDEISQRWPALDDRGFVGAGFRADDGWCNQYRVIEGLARGAAAAGAEVLVGTEAVGLESSGDRVIGVATPEGLIAADAVLVATGPWVTPLLDPFGIGREVSPRRHELLIVEPRDAMPAIPWLILGDAVHVRPDLPGRALVGGFLGQDPQVDPDTYDRSPSASWTKAVLEKAHEAFGVVGPDANVMRGWAGLYPSTPDRHPIIDQLAEGLFVALGFSGTGLMHAPAAAMLCSELILDGTISSVDGALLSAHRFTHDDFTTETTGF